MTVKAFKTDDAHFLYSSWTNEISAVSPQLYETFSDPDTAPRNLARDLGLVPADGMQISVFGDNTVERALDRLADTGPEHLVFTITDACNFRCDYCAYSGAYQDARTHGQQRMRPEILFKGLRWYFGFDRPRYHIGFYGGEPLLQLKLIRKGVQEARDLAKGAPVTFGMTTNGWLLGKDTNAFLAKNAVDLFISIDGPKPTNDRYRKTVKGKGTFDRVLANIRRLRDDHPDYFDRHVNFSITLVPPCDLDEISAFLAETRDVFGGKIPKVGLLNGGPSDIYDQLEVPEASRRIDFTDLQSEYVSDLVAGKPPSAFARACCEPPLLRIHRRNMTAVPRLTTSCGQCVPGTRCHVSVDGDLFMCEHGDESFPIGHVDTGLDPVRISNILSEYGTLIKGHCEGCWAVRLCHKCIPDLSDGNRLSSERLAELCGSRRRAIEADLIGYCRARSGNDTCFDTLSAQPGG